MVTRIISLAASLVLTGCALEPNQTRIEVEHVSHVSQHFGPAPANDGYNQVAIVGHWHLGPSAYVEVSEGLNLNARDDMARLAYGGLAGPREVFSARVGVILPFGRP